MTSTLKTAATLTKRIERLSVALAMFTLHVSSKSKAQNIARELIAVMQMRDRLTTKKGNI